MKRRGQRTRARHPRVRSLAVRFRCAGVLSLASLLAALVLAGAPASVQGAGLASDHWSFQSVRRPQPPGVSNPAWSRTSIDPFILARLEREGVRPAPPAEPATWLRRVTLDLTGLPPSPEAMEAFVRDALPGREERAVEALLASPAHGERWAQHWLDVVRYADTHGFEVNTERPSAWPYRDYVIRAVHDDVPYDRFVREQVCGDLLGADAATGFLVTASVLLPGQIGKDEPSIRLARQDALDEVVVNISQTFLGLSVSCARCHDHKFDPVSQAEYYAMQAFVAGVEYEERELGGPDAEARRVEADDIRTRLAGIVLKRSRLVPAAGGGGRRVPVNGRLNIERFAPTMARKVRLTMRETNSLEPCIDELEAWTPDDANVAAADHGASVESDGDTVDPGRHELRHLNDGRYGNARSWMSGQKGKGRVVVTFARESLIDRVFWGRDREGQYDDRLATSYTVEVADDSGAWRVVASSEDRERFLAGTNASDPFATSGLSPDDARQSAAWIAERAALEKRLKSVQSGQRAFVGMFRKPDRIRLLRRGDPEQPREDVVPAVPAVLGTLRLPADAPDADRRRALADWLASPANPLTARVMANRVWQGHFGTGLVPTPSDLGLNGVPPTNAALIDWLASELVRSGWSVRHLHRLIVLSATYRQATTRPGEAAGAGPRADLWARFPARRLEAETLRDSMLAVSGRLNRERHGPGFDLFDLRGGLSGFKPVESFGPGGRRRMVYAHKVRREREAVFGAFDCPDAGQSTERRRESVTAIQALNLFNSRFTIDEAEALALRVRGEAGPDVAAQVHRAWHVALGRFPTPDEWSEATPVAREHGVAAVCRALFNSGEFVFLP